jgi:hypothetical protein
MVTRQELPAPRDRDPVPLWSALSPRPGELTPTTPARRLRLPWRSVGAPQRDALNLHAQRWAEHVGLIASDRLAGKLRAVDAGGLVALTYPGTRFEAQRVLVELFAWVFLHDDVYDEVEGAHDPERLGQTLRGYIAILDGMDPSAGGPVSALALADLRSKLVHLGGARWFARFSATMGHYWLDGVLEEARHRARGITPTIERYHQVRLESVCVYPVLDLIEAAYGFMLSPDVVDDPLLHEVRRLAAWAIALSNDVFSYDKETRAGDPHNLVYLLTVLEGRSLEDAFASVVAAHNDLVARFDDVAASLERRSPSLPLYVEGHRRWMKGAYDWQLGSRRYAPVSPAALAEPRDVRRRQPDPGERLDDRGRDRRRVPLPWRLLRESGIVARGAGDARAPRLGRVGGPA